MEELDIATVTKRSIHGVFALVSRTFFIQIVSVVVNFLLTIFLSPSVFGIFFVVSAAITFLSYFSDIGLAAALIQKKEKVTEDELKTVFTIQQGLVIILSGFALLMSGFIGSFYNLQQDGILLFQALVIAFFLSSLKTIPSILLERELQFQELVIPQIVETLFFNIIVLIFAIKGFGITSFTYGVLARGVSGLITMYIINPWPIQIGISHEAAKRLMSFGIPFQLNSIMALLKDELLTIYLGKVLPLAQVGYIGFAQKWAFMPMRLIMDNVIRITFPSFSRLAHEKEYLGIAIEKALFTITFFILPTLFGLVILSPYFIEIIPKYNKWEPALLSLMFFAINASLSSISTPLTNALNAIGRIRITLYLMVFWTALTWIITPLSILNWGFNGVSYASAIIATSVILVVYISKRYIQLNALSSIKIPLIASTVMGIVLYFASTVIISDTITLMIMILFGIIVYFGIVFLIGRKELLSDIKLIIKYLKSSMNKISVVISVYNAQDLIKQCLESVQWADEIIVIDNTSSDNTPEIVRQFTSKIFTRPNNLMLNVNKNFGFTKATHEWILNLDSDEKITPDLAEEIKEIIQKKSSSDGYFIPRKNIIFGKWIQHAGWYPGYQLRLFKKEKGKFKEEHVHELIQVEGATEQLKHNIEHYNYQTVSQFIEKLNTIYTPNEAKELQRKGYTFNYLDAIRFPTKEFLRRFFAQEGYKDGLHGLVLSLFMAFYHFVIFTRLWEEEKFKEVSSEHFMEDVEEEFKNKKKEIKYWIWHEKLKKASSISRLFLKLRRVLR